MRSFFVFEQGDLETSICQRDLLQLVEKRNLPRHIGKSYRISKRKKARARADLGCVCSGSELPRRLHLFSGCLAEFLHISTGQIELADLLLQCHASQQI